MGKIIKAVTMAMMSACLACTFSGCAASGVGSEYFEMLKQLIEDAGIADYFGGVGSEDSSTLGTSSSEKNESDSIGDEEDSGSDTLGDPANGYCPDSPDGTHVFNTDEECIYCAGHICEYTIFIELIKSSNCQESGLMLYACYQCGATVEIVVDANPKDHERGAIAGSHKYQCVICGQVEALDVGYHIHTDYAGTGYCGWCSTKIIEHLHVDDDVDGVCDTCDAAVE